ncbi:MAG: AAA family ATPase, partial [Candidatus Rokubacteria bacterium]|nr:AAA family ATPase [Candidatus Rokubacteria bacterium]
MGREEDLRILTDHIGRLGDRGGGVVSILGEPGVGKSRLLAETRRAAADRDVLWLEGRSLSFTQAIGYWPFLDIFRQYAGITEEDDNVASWGKLDRRLDALGGGQTREILPYLATLLGIRVGEEFQERVRHLDGLAMGRQISLSVRRFFERLARAHPVVLVFEDLHWIDQSSAEMLEHLLPLVDTLPLLVVVVSRVERDTSGARLRQVASEKVAIFTEITLSPLTPAGAAELLRNLLGVEPSASLRDFVVSKAEGNPFFIEEVLRTLIAAGVLTRDATTGAWRLAHTTRIEQVTIPDTIEGVIMARVDRLDDELKQVLKLAAVIGRSFFYRILQGIADAERQLDRQLFELQQVELIREKRRLPELEYYFKHALVQEATYESILAERRRLLHRRVGETIEALFTDRLEEFAGLLAYHYARAEEWDKAKDYLSRAGDYAGRIAADTEALAHYGQALAACERVFGESWDPAQRAVLERKMGEALFRRGDHQQAVDYLRAALAHLGHPLPGSPARVRLAIGGQIVRQLRYRILGSFTRWGLAPIDVGSEERIRIYQVMAWIDYFMDQERAVLDALLALNVSEQLGYMRGLVQGCSGVGVLGDLLRLYRVAGFYHRRAGELAEHTDHLPARGLAALGQGLHQYQLGESDAAA